MSQDDDVGSQIRDVLGESLVDLIATAARKHNVSITISVIPFDVTMDTPRDPNDE